MFKIAAAGINNGFTLDVVTTWQLRICSPPANQFLLQRGIAGYRPSPVGSTACRQYEDWQNVDK